MWTGEFWFATIERAIKTLAQSIVGMLVADSSGLLDTDWAAVLSVGGMVAIVSVLTSIASGAVGDDPSPSLSSERLAELRDYGDPDDLDIDPDDSTFGDDEQDTNV